MLMHDLLLLANNSSFINHFNLCVSMKKLLVLFFLCLMAVAARAEIVVYTFNPAESPITPAASPLVIDYGDVMFSVSNGYLTGTQCRVYKNETLTITSSVGPIVRIELDCVGANDEQYGPGNFTVDQGEYAARDNMGIWSGASSAVVLTATFGQVRIVMARAYVDTGYDSLKAPVITPAGGVYSAPVEVTITGNSDATIHYTLDGSDPTADSAQYTGPFMVSDDTVVKAVQILDGEMSQVAVAEYRFEDAVQVSGISEYQALPDGTRVYFTSPVTVLAQYRYRLYVTDGTGCALFYGDSGQEYNNGDVIPAGFTGIKVTYDGEPELTELNGFKPAMGYNLVNVERISPDQVDHDMFAHYVCIENVSLTQVGNYKYIATDADGNQCTVYYGSMGANAPSYLNTFYNIYGIVGSFKQGDEIIYELLPTEYISAERFGLGDLEGLPSNTELAMGYNAIVLWQKGNYLYLKDDTGYGLVYGNVGQNYVQGDVIPMGYGGKVIYYKGKPELSTPSGFQPPIDHVMVVPERYRCADVGSPIWGHFVLLENVMIDTYNNKLTDSSGSCDFYNYTFGADMPTNLNVPHDVYGIVGVFNDYQILPCYFDQPPVQDTIHVSCLDELYVLDQGVKAIFDKPLTVIYQNGYHLYARDENGQYALLYGHMSDHFVNGDRIIGNASWEFYNRYIRELYPDGDWHKVGHGPAVKPIEGIVEELDFSMVHSYVSFNDVSITLNENGYTFTLTDDTEDLVVYDLFSVEVGKFVDLMELHDVNCDGEVNIADINMVISAILSGQRAPARIDAGEDLSGSFDVRGFMTIFSGELELYPIEILPHADRHQCDVNGDGELNIADVNSLISLILAQ